MDFNIKLGFKPGILFLGLGQETRHLGYLFILRSRFYVICTVQVLNKCHLNWMSFFSNYNLGLNDREN